jgi:hypothetical protein
LARNDRYRGGFAAFARVLPTVLLATADPP